LEEKLEEERSHLSGGIPVTLERFLAWKEAKKKKREQEWEEKREAEAKKTGGKGLNVLSGRALFKFDPTLFQDDNDALDDAEYEEEERKEGDGEEGDEGEENGDGEEENKEQEHITPSEGHDGSNQTEQKEGETEIQGTKKKSKKKKKVVGDAQNVKINEDVFLDEDDVPLPEDLL